MKQHLLERNIRKKTVPLQSHIMKKTYQSKTTEIVPIFAARQRSICEYFTSSDNRQPKRMMKKLSKMQKEYHPSIPQPRTTITFRKNQGRSFKISSYLNKTAYAQNIASFSKTNTNKKPFRTLNHHYRMKIALIKTKLKTKPSHQVINNS